MPRPHLSAPRTAVAALAALLSLSAPASAHGPEPLDRAPTLFHNVNVVSMAAPGVQSDRSVLIRDGRIAAIAHKDELKPEDGVRVIDGGGTAYLIPGLADMHLHIPPTPGDKGDPTWRTAALLIANGVTTARGLAGHPAHTAVRDRILAGDLLGPTLHVAGPPLHIGAVKTPEDAAAKVREQAAAGFDLIKSHHLPVPEIYDAVQAAARELRIPVSGHVANEVGLDRALAAGQQIEHLDGYLAALAGDKAMQHPFGQFPSLVLLLGIDRDAIPPLARRVADSGVWNTPTLALFAKVVNTERPMAELRDAPEMRYIADQAITAWTNQRDAAIKAGHFNAGYAATLPPLRARITLALHEAGAPLLAGSDSPQAFLAPGFALHDELAALVDAGLSPWDALQSATANPARYFQSLPNAGSAAGVRPDFGTIEVGKRADLVLLRADPTADIAGARQISGVMLRGRWLARTDLDALLEAVAASVGKS